MERQPSTSSTHGPTLHGRHRGLSITIPPFIDWSFLCGKDPPSSTYDHTEYVNPLPSMYDPVQAKEYYETHNLTSIETGTSIATITMTRDQLKILKANSKGDNKNQEKYITFEIFATHVWRCPCISRGMLMTNPPNCTSLPTRGTDCILLSRSTTLAM
ncbi:hypothetical protein Vadar_000141 [Vaccinium darrowii]|uniref:Uncharacterized protein n=1 Tax=Vaccinium darrowii TaxID=229202 RepID=A0ACB7XM80_9ERIC|nr:hypothetical protein Vadar_000141 [Vaccinium darrowii]